MQVQRVLAQRPVSLHHGCNPLVRDGHVPLRARSLPRDTLPLHQDHPPLPQDRPHLPQDHLPPPLGRSPSNASQKEREAMQRRPQLPFITVEETSENKM